MFVVKCEIVYVEDDLYEVTKIFRGDVLIVAFAKEKAAASIPSLCGMLVLREVTLSVTSMALSGRVLIVFKLASLLRKSVVSLT